MAAFSAEIAYPNRVAAHCPGTLEHQSVSADRNPKTGQYVNGVRGVIEWDNPSNCLDQYGVNHAIALLYDNFGFIEVGTYKKSGMSAPKGYCEQLHPYDLAKYRFYEFPILNGLHTSALIFTAEYWHCKWGGDTYQAWTRQQVGFNSSDGLVTVHAEGEVRHAQLGEMAPDRLTFTQLNLRWTTGTSWNTMQPTLNAVSSPYGADKPGGTVIEVWTNAH
ncbi:hypothetical protein BH24ACT15_BH24ACT15_37250 [soil metagenome]